MTHVIQEHFDEGGAVEVSDLLVPPHPLPLGLPTCHLITLVHFLQQD